mmetsp:Transcript_66336/g.213793  ORF Transcript_66336/g.213793 Transcript_66336/m.213793 type:complete len:206 (+) Transcript_66336:76-693(+)
MLSQIFGGCCAATSDAEVENEDFEEWYRDLEQYNHRITKELQRLQKRLPLGVSSVEPVDGNMRQWQVLIDGPRDTPYSGGSFELEVCLPRAYPFAPPEIHFKTKIYHVNVDFDSGCICSSDFQWEAAKTISLLLEVIVGMMHVPDAQQSVPGEYKQADPPAESQVVRMFLEDRIQYNRIASQWTQQHARPSGALNRGLNAVGMPS